MKKKHISTKKLFNFIFDNKKDLEIEKHLSDCDQCSDDVYISTKLLNIKAEKIRPGKKDAMRTVIVNAALEQLNDSYEKPKRFTLKYAISTGILCIIFFLAGLFLFRQKDVSEQFLTVKSKNPEIIKTVYKNEKAYFPFTIKTDKKAICKIKGILNTKFLFYGPGKLTIYKQKNSQRYIIKLEKGDLFVSSKKGLKKKINFETSKAKIVMIGAEAWVSTSKNDLKVAVLKGNVSLIDKIKLKKTKIKKGHYFNISKNKAKPIEQPLTLMGRQVKTIGSKFFSNWKKFIGMKVIKQHNIISANKSYIITLKNGSFIKAMILKIHKNKIVIFDGFKKITILKKNIRIINKMKKLGTAPLK